MALRLNIILLFLVKWIQSHNITVHYTKLMTSTKLVSYIDTTLLTVMNVGNPKQPYLFAVSNYEFDSIWMSTRLYNNTKSTSYEDLSSNHTIIIKNINYKCISSSESFYFKGLEVDNIKFCLIKRKAIPYNHDGILALDMNQNKSHMTLLDQLKGKGLISHKSFSLKYNEDEERGELILGIDSPNEEDELSPYASCQIPEQSHNWICLMKNNKKNKIDITSISRVLFKINYAFIACPPLYFQYIINDYLSEYFSNNQCKIASADNETVKWIECDKSIPYESFKPLIFSFESFTITIPSKDLFTTLLFHNNTIVFGIVEQNKSDQFDWIFGDLALNSYDIIFDQDNRKIFFANADIIANKQTKSKLYVYTFYLSFIILISLFIAFYVRYRYGKRKGINIDVEWNNFMKLETFNLQSY